MRDRNNFTQEIKAQATILGIGTAIFWLAEIADAVFFQGHLDRYGIVPRHFIGLRGILLAPFLHGGFVHLTANTLPFLTLGWLVMVQETSDFFIVTLFSMVIGGLGVWLFGAPNVHIGASGVIFGYLGFLLLRGYFQRNVPSILLSILVFFLYGGLIWGVLPADPRISWEGHLFGFLGGVLAAKAIAQEKRVYR
ncbi:MAG: rhomboid family intramembrane serine protease [Chloroflexaceae bacterium]|nr:rhomboid family intramembrane serine protease [Chloroflexaceae bacterium]